MAGDEGYGSPAAGPSVPFTANIPQAAAPTTLSLYRRSQPAHLGAASSSSQPDPRTQTQVQTSISKPSTSSRAFIPGVLPNTQLSTANGSAARLAGLTQPVPAAPKDAPSTRPSASAPPSSHLNNIPEVSEPPTSPAHRTRSQVLERERHGSSPAPALASSSPGSGKEKHRSSRKKTPGASQKRMQTRSNSNSAVDRPSPSVRAAIPPVVSSSAAPVSKDTTEAPTRPALSSKNGNTALTDNASTQEPKSNKRKAEILQSEASIKTKGLTRSVSAASSSDTVTGDGDESSRNGPSPNKRTRRSAAPRLTDASSLLPPTSRASNPFAETGANAILPGSVSQSRQITPLPAAAPASQTNPIAAATLPDSRGAKKDVILQQKQKAQALLARPAVSTPLSTVTQANTSANAPSPARPTSRASSPQRRFPIKQPAVAQLLPKQSNTGPALSTPQDEETDSRSALVNALVTELSKNAAMEAVHKESQAHIAYMTSQTTNLQQQVERLRTSKNEYRQHASDRQALAASKIELEGKIVLLKDDLKRTEREMNETIGQIYSEALAMFDDYLFSNNMVTEENVDALSKAFSNLPAATVQSHKLHAFKKLLQAGIKFVEEWYDRQAAEVAASDTSAEEIASLKKQISEGLQTAASLKAELSSVTSSRNTSENEVGRLEVALSDAKAELKSARELAATLTTTFDNNVTKLREDLKALQQTLADEKSASAKKEDELRNSLDVMTKDHSSTVHELESKHSSALLEKSEEISSVTQQIAILQTKLANAEANFDAESQRAKASELKAESTTIDLQAKLGSQQLDVLTLQTEREDLLSRLNTQSLQYKAAQDKIAALEASALTSASSSQDDTISIEIAERGLLGILEKLVEIDGLADASPNALADEATLEDIQQAISKAITNLQVIVTKVITQREEGKEGLTASNAEIARSQECRLELEKSVATLQAQLESQQSEKDQLQKEVQRGKKAVGETAAQLVSLQSNLSEEKVQSVHIQSKVELLTKQLEEKEDSLVAQKQRHEDTQQKLDLQRDQLSAVVAERNLMSTQLEAVRGELSATQIKYHEALSSAAVANSEIKVHLAAITQKEQELSARKDQWAKLESLQSDITLRDERIKELQGSLTSKETEMSDLSTLHEQERQKWSEESKVLQEEARQAGSKADLQIKNIQEQSKKELSMKENDYKKLTRKFNDLQARHTHLQEERNREKNRPTIPQDSSPLPETAVQGLIITSTQVQTQTGSSRDNKPPSKPEGIKHVLAPGQPLNRPRSSEVTRAPSIPCIEGNSSLTDQGDDSEGEAGEVPSPSKMTENILQALNASTVASQPRTTRSSSKRAQSASTGDASPIANNKSDDEESGGVKKRRRI